MNRGTWSRAECWARMRILCCILLCFCLMGCGRDARDESAIIRRRAEQFGDLLVRIQDMPELEAKRTLEGFIEPSPTRADRLAQYYREFSAASEKFRIVSQTVENIRISSDRVNAEVTYGMIAQPPGGTSISALQVTHWKHVAANGTAPSEKLKRGSIFDDCSHRPLTHRIGSPGLTTKDQARVPHHPAYGSVPGGSDEAPVLAAPAVLPSSAPARHTIPIAPLKRSQG